MSINVSVNAEMRGEYTLTRRRADTGEVVQQIGPFPNLILNNGLDRIGFRAPQVKAFVGTSNATPEVTQTTLVAPRAMSDGQSGSGYSVGIEGDWRVIRTSATYTFPAGRATGNLSEVGVGDGSSTASYNLFSRALILDTAGNPTTITVLADEVLDVTYTLHTYYSLLDQTSTVTINGVQYTVTTRPGEINSNSSWITKDVTAFYVERCWDSSASFGTIYEMMRGNGIATGTISGQNPVYQGTGTYTFRTTNVFPLNSCNGVGGIGGIYIGIGSGVQSMWSTKTQVKFTPPIPKNNTNVLTLVLSFSWGRRA